MTVVASPARWKQKDRFKTYRVRSTHFSDIYVVFLFIVTKGTKTKTL